MAKKKETVKVEELKLGQIVLCNLTLKSSKKESFVLKKVIFSHPYKYRRMVLKYDNLNDKRLISLTNFKEDLEIIDIHIISKHGFKNKSKGFTEVKKTASNIRNKITGMYE